MSTLSAEECKEEIMKVHEKVKELTGTDMHVFRPPIFCVSSLPHAASKLKATFLSGVSTQYIGSSLLDILLLNTAVTGFVELGNHSENHKQMSTLSAEECKEEIMKVHEKQDHFS